MKLRFTDFFLNEFDNCNKKYDIGLKALGKAHYADKSDYY